MITFATYNTETYTTYNFVLGSLFSALIVRRSLVVAGHVTTQNLGAKKSVGREGWQSVLFVAAGNFVGFKTSSSP